METHKPAGFFSRLLASLLNSAIFWLVHFFFFGYIAGSPNLETLVFRAVVYIVFVLLPSWFIIGLLYPSVMTYYFGGHLGKLLTGLRVTDEEGKRLSFRRLLFRHTIGYMFSGIFFGLGYLSIFKDERQQAWHDKAVGSRVWMVRPLWPLALGLLIIILGINGYLVGKAIQSITQSAIPQQIRQIGEE